MSIRFGTSITRGKRAYDRRCRGARDGAMAATTAIPPRRDRKRTATHARATAGMQVRGANVQHSNARGRSATHGVCDRAQRGCPEGRDGTSLCRGAQASLWKTGLVPGRTAARRCTTARTAAPGRHVLLLTQRSRRGLQGHPGAALEFYESSRSSSPRLACAASSSLEHPMDQPTTPAEQAARAAERLRRRVRAGRRRTRPRATAGTSSRAARASGSPTSGARSTASRTSSRSRRSPRSGSSTARRPASRSCTPCSPPGARSRPPAARST